MTDGPMNAVRLRAILEAYGADPARWPSSERAAAETLLAQLPEAQAWQADAAGIDHLLDRLTVPAPSSALIGGIMERLAEIPPPGWLRTILGEVPLWRACGGVAALLLVGVLIGWSVGLPGVEPTAGVLALDGWALGIVETSGEM